ncbi:MAG: GNAT family N-acetyltransferase [Chloroflexi bacterium]|nr:GNAT family N-acetyltransferase [Chloroflexota bacterium]
MFPARIRQMTPADVRAVAATLVAADFGDRGSWLAFATGHPACRTLVAEAGGVIVGTGVGTANGPAGWLATIWVAPDRRRQGLGRAITQELLDQLAAAGCGTYVLVATDEGRRLYEAMGFERQASYRILEAPGTSAGPGSEADFAGIDGRVRAFAATDLGPVLQLDRRATGEDRRHVIEPFASPASARVLEVEGEIRGFVIRAPWGGGATIAVDQAAALELLAARRHHSGPSGRVRVGLLDTNVAGLEALAADGYRPVWSAPRLAMGASLDWRPDWIWGQFNHAIG